ncbi:MAG: signal peptidase I [Clostridiales bacterium]|nr:signal peptidase I [Clostridiales bacterium]
MKKHDRDRQLNKEPKEILDEVSEVKETVEETSEEAAEAAEDSVEEIAEAAEESVEVAADTAEDVAETAEEVVEEVNDLTDKDEVESAFEAEASDDVVLQGAILLETADADADEIPENVPVEDATETFTETSDEESEKIPVSVPVEDPTETFTETSDEEESDEETADSEEEKDEEDSDEESDKDEEDAEEESEEDSDDEDEDEDEEKDKEESEKEKSALYMFFDTIKFVAIGLLIGILLVVFVVQRNDVYGSSMEPTLHTGDAVFVEMISVYTGNFSRGDIITIDAKGMDGYAHEENLIKRIVGLPGETIKIADGLVYINGELLDESDYLPAGTMTYVGAEGQARGYDEVTLGPDEYYCMGDNRGGSNDSRRMGPFKKSQIDAKVLMRIYPFNKMKFF